MGSRQGVWVVLLVTAALGGLPRPAFTAQQGEEVNRRAFIVGHVPQGDGSAVYSLPHQPARGTMASLFLRSPATSSRPAGQEYFLGMPWLTIPNSPADDEVIAEHRLRSGRHTRSSLAILDVDSTTHPATSTDKVLDTYDVSVIGSVRFKF